MSAGPRPAAAAQQQPRDDDDVLPDPVQPGVALVDADFPKAERAAETATCPVVWKDARGELPEPSPLALGDQPGQSNPTTR